MEVSDCIKKRRSIRVYLDKKVPQKDLAKVLEAGHYAPSSGNIQNWKFLVVSDAENREIIARCCLDQLWMTEAPIHIVICSDNELIKKQYPKRWKKFSTQNCAAVIQNMLLQAQDLGLSTCWVGAISNKLKLKNTLEIPDSIDIEAIITLGYSNEKPLSNRHKLEELTFFESYGTRTRDVSLFPLEKHLKRFKR